jgi:hypothetical protein
MTTTQATKRNKLDIQAEGLNILNAYGIEVLTHIHPQLELLKGKKVVLADGSKSAKWNVTQYKKEDVKVPGVKFISYQYYFKFSAYSVWLELKICIHGGSYDDQTYYCEYFEKSLHLGELKEQTLSTVNELRQMIKTNALQETFTETGLQDVVKQYDQMKSKTRDLYYSIPESVKKACFISQ